ncbi:MAG: metallophosphoesterase [Promethearchaeota archaeon]
MQLELIENEPAVILYEEPRRVLVVADLHIGYERTLFKQEFYSTNLTLQIIQQIRQLVKKQRPTEIIILGDLKHSIQDFSKQEFQQVAQLLFDLQQQAAVTIVRGNHDADLELVTPDDTQIVSAAGFSLRFKSNQVYFLHGHAYPSADILSCDSLLMGHIHPAVSISKLKERVSIHRVWMRTKWNSTIIEALKSCLGEIHFQKEPRIVQRLLRMNVLVIPAYNSLLQGHILNKEPLNMFLGSPLFRHLSLEDAEIVMLDHTPLGTLKQLTE